MIICEIGQNFAGNLLLAKTLIRLAKENGGDLAKFQLYSHAQLYKDHPEIPNVELSFCDAKMLFDYGKEIGMEVFFSVFDVERVKWCETIGVKRYKIAGTLKDLNVISFIVGTGKEIISSNPEVGHIRLFCINEYPTPLDYRLLQWNIVTNFDGLSDHTIGLDAAKIALARGAQIIEKHFAIDHDTGIDAKWSMTPSELKELKRWHEVCKQVL